MNWKSWGAMWPAFCARRRAPGSPTRSAVYNRGSHCETLVCRGGRGGPAPAHRGSGRIAPGGCPLPGAVLPHGAGRPARRPAEAFPARSGHFPERWCAFSGALGTRSGRQPHLLRTFRSDRARDSPHFVRKFPLRPRILNLSGNLASRTVRWGFQKWGKLRNTARRTL